MRLVSGVIFSIVHNNTCTAPLEHFAVPYNSYCMSALNFERLINMRTTVAFTVVREWLRKMCLRCHNGNNGLKGHCSLFCRPLNVLSKGVWMCSSTVVRVYGMSLVNSNVEGEWRRHGTNFDV
jgi:hypothetical protein